MALVPLATKGNYFHVYDFRVKPGTGERFIELFNKFDYGDNNPFHRSDKQVKDGVLCRDAGDPGGSERRAGGDWRLGLGRRILPHENEITPGNAGRAIWLAG